MFEHSTIRQLLNRASTELKQAGVPNPRPDAELLLCEAHGFDRETLYRELDADSEESAIERFNDLVARRAGRCPIAYILGWREFWSLSLKVDSRVLIPRHETEILVETALRHAGSGQVIAEVGTGSGCIMAALASELDDCRLVATDASGDALDIARDNLDALGFTDRIRLFKADRLDIPHEPFHLILSNPPYVSESDWRELMPEVRDFEPKEALVPGETGLEFYPLLAESARESLRPDGLLIAEMGAGQADEVSKIFEGYGLHTAEILKDWAGWPRVIVAGKSRVAATG